jgi:hypothetical protein
MLAMNNASFRIQFWEGHHLNSKPEIKPTIIMSIVRAIYVDLVVDARFD